MTNPRNAELIMDVLTGLQRRKGFLGLKVETFNLIVTSRRLVFAAVSSGLMKEAIMQARREAKGHGAGFMGQWGAQLGWMKVLERRFFLIAVNAFLEQFPGSFSLLHTDVRSIVARSDEDDEGGRVTHEVLIETAGEKLRFQLTHGTADEAREVLGQHIANV